MYSFSSTEFRLPVSNGRGLYFVSPEDIIRLEAKSNYTNIHLRDQKIFVSAKVLKNYDRQLQPFGFIRTHRSHLVNRRHVLFVDEGNEVVMNDASVAEISRRKRKRVLSELMK